MNYDKIGTLICELRKEKNMTQKNLADKLGITDRAVSKWERGLGCPDVSLLDDLSRELDISVIEILKGRKLDENEVIENKDLIESMTFTERNLKKKIGKIVGMIISLIIIVLLSIVLYFSLGLISTINARYEILPLSDEQISINDDYEKYKEIILNNQGDYTDEEYSLIIDYVNESSGYLVDMDIERYNKTNFYEPFNDDRRDFSFVSMWFYFSLNEEKRYDVYNIVISHDESYLDDLFINDLSSDDFLSIVIEDKDFPEEDIMLDYSEKIWRIYLSEVNLLKYIIEVGDMNE